MQDDGPKLHARPPRAHYSREEVLTLVFCKLLNLSPSLFIESRDEIAMRRKMKYHCFETDGVLSSTRDVQTVLRLLDQIYSPRC